MNKGLILQEVIAGKIYLIRGKKVMLDRDLAGLYVVETRQLTRQVRRNMDRFPDDFMFQLSKEEFSNLKAISAHQVGVELVSSRWSLANTAY
ncbi:MAG: ORF6N domain-containing protein [Candidatus Omnitrophota bacterium]